MLLETKVKLKWNNAFKKYYETKGYQYTKRGEEFTVDIIDLQPTSTFKVKYKCDYCGEDNLTKEYRAYLEQREIIEKDCCSNRKCMVAKTKDVNLIVLGVESVNQLEEKKNKARLKNQTPIQEVIKLANNKGLEVVDYTGYENGKSKIKVVCTIHPELGIHETNASNIKSQSHCCKIGGSEATGKSKRVEGELVVDAFIKKGLIPLFNANDYTANSQPLPFKCPAHPNEIQYRQFSNLPYTEGCLYCSKERTANALKLNQSDVFTYFEQRDLIVESGETYKTKDAHIACRCIHHPDEIQYKAYHALKSTDVPCIYCRNEKSFSELSRFLRSTVLDWKRKSEKECNYKCVLTNSSNYEVHHTYSFNKVIKEVVNELGVNNFDCDSKDIINIKRTTVERHKLIKGVCIRPDLHILFHRLYGKENNTPE